MVCYNDKDKDMEMTVRQKEILNSIVAEYIRSAQPVSS
jgi:transcriptional regulator of heat shock response